MTWITFRTVRMDYTFCVAGLIHIISISSIFHSAIAQQTFRIEPSDRQGIRGQTILLPCGIDNLVGTVTWMRDGFGLGTQTDLPGYSRYKLDGAQERGEYTLMISNLQLEDDASYQCQVIATKSTPMLASRFATVTVFIPPDEPTIEKGPTVEVIAGEPFNLTCRAENGKPAAQISWFRGAMPITEDVFYEAENQTAEKLQNASSWVTIVPRKADQGRKYYCEANNEATPGHPKTTSASLEVLYPPEVSMVVRPDYNKLSEGDTVTFSCDAYGNPAAMSWKWFRGSEELNDKTSHTLVQRIDRDWHNTRVECEATNKVGSVRQGVVLNVKYPPRFTKGAEHVAADVGDDATLSCAVDSNPEPTVIWVKEGAIRILSSSLTLTVYNVKETDFGVYSCRASIQNMEPIAMGVHLLKKGVPRIRSPVEQSARFGETGVVECAVRSVPKPTTITWEKDGVVLSFKDLPRYSTREEDLADGKRNMIEITSVQAGDYGTYNCTVNNGLGVDEIQISFTKQDVVPLEYIIAGVLVGVFIIIVIAVVIVVYHRKKAASSDTDSETSESSISKKKNGLPPYKVQYQAGTYGNPNIVAAWNSEADKNLYRNSAEYDELNFAKKDPWGASDPYDYHDHGNIYGSHHGGAAPGYARSDYGTYPGPARSNVYDAGPYGSQSIYGGPAYSDYGIYGTYGGHHRPPPPRSDFMPASDLGRPSTAMSNRLATNV